MALSILVLTAISLAIRLPRLDQRPMHPDEANQAEKAGMLAGMLPDAYRYDPNEHHGPTLYWCTLASLRLYGASSFAQTREEMYRIVPVVFGAGLVVLLLLVADGLSAGPVVAAAALTAISPAMVYYARYYIQETLLVFFTFAAIGCGWRWWRTRRLGWAIGAGAAVGMMHATKETWVLAGAAMAAGVILTGLWTRWRDGTPWSIRPRLRPAHGLAALAAACVAAVALFSSFGRDWKGPLDSVRAYATYLHRGSEGGIHAAPWYEYLRLLVAFHPARRFFWTEGLIVGLAAVGGMCSLFLGAKGSGVFFHVGGKTLPCPTTHNADMGEDSRPLLTFCRFLTFYTLVLLALYSAIPYKTPWCLLSFLHGMILLAGVGAYAIVRWARILPLRILVGGLLLAATAHLGWETYWLNFRLYADQRNPYVYAHTSSDVLNLAAQMERLAQAAPEGHEMVIHVISSENYWPLPWYLRRFDRDHVGYWSSTESWARDAATAAPPSVILLTSEAQATVDSHLRAAYNRQMMFGLRPGVFISAYVREDVWQAFLKTK